MRMSSCVEAVGGVGGCIPAGAFAVDAVRL